MKKNETIRKTIEINDDLWDFLQFLRLTKRHKSFKSFLEEYLGKIKEDEKVLYELFLQKKEIDRKISEATKK